MRLFVSLLFVCLLAGCADEERPLPQLGIEIEQTSVSGFSAGAYMAGQVQLAHAHSIVGAGLVAGGPFGCAESAGGRLVPYWPTAVAQNLAQALNGCMADRLRPFGVPNVPALAARAQELARDGAIDPLDDLAKDRIYLFSGGTDRIVARSIVEAAEDFYLDVGVPAEQIALVAQPQAAGHAFLTEDAGSACGTSARPFLNDCDYDQAGAILSWIYGDLSPPADHASGKFIAFDQSRFATGNAHGLSKEGIIYVPEDCAARKGCRLHIVLHGCEQSRDLIGMAFIEGSGFARWADTNRLVVLFPQVAARAANPKACWDWWGYTGLDFLTKEAPQIEAIWAMAERLAEPR